MLIVNSRQEVGLGHSRKQKAESREKILRSASTRIREEGIERLSVAELMKSAGLTHGGFYSHFSSRAEMVAASLERALGDGNDFLQAGVQDRGPQTVKSLVNGYLSVFHRDNPGSGCAVSAVGGEVSRADPELREVMQAMIERSLATMSEVHGGERSEEFSMAAWSTMVGALVLSRILSGDPKSEDILASARSAVLTLDEAYRKRPSDESTASSGDAKRSL